jgi:hypothetical protein
LHLKALPAIQPSFSSPPERVDAIASQIARQRAAARRLAVRAPRAATLPRREQRDERAPPYSRSVGSMLLADDQNMIEPPTPKRSDQTLRLVRDRKPPRLDFPANSRPAPVQP